MAELSKQDEINQLRQFVGNLAPQGYLSSMFDNVLVNHIVEQIRNDFGFIDHKGIADYHKLIGIGIH